ncbi:gastrula zinc finger protein xFG20-1-like isoform X4 [Phthorimaea operculella]|nr:gastrula zinc finger protein xFG20-1-like isoform X4 [Phthorimaea operculella]
MDITNLKCNLCEEKFTTSEQIITHLNESHTKNILPDIKNLIMPFKFEDNELRCKRREFHERASENQVKFEEVTIKTEIKEKVKSPAVKEKRENKKKNLELQSWRAAVRTLLASCNATAIRNHTDKGYGCCFCREQFPDPAELKTHCADNHKDDISKFKGDKEQAKFFVKMDITNLKCNLCDSDFATVEQIVAHLNETHNKDILSDIIRLIIPFKFDSSDLRCCECLHPCYSFTLLQAHMHSHYRNYICDICSAGFVTLKALQAHRTTHDTGSAKCTYCFKVFDSLRKAKKHESCVHTDETRRSVCRFCGERFKTYTAKQKHLKEVHGVVPNSVKCLACDKIFPRKDLLVYHTKKYHLMLRPHKCTECDRECFTASDLARHMAMHSTERKFCCELCPKTFRFKIWIILKHEAQKMGKSNLDNTFFFFIGKRREYGENASDKEVKFEEVNVKYESKDDANACAPVNREKRIPNANLELQSWRVAVRSVLACSNATVIRNHTDKGYGCCFCREQFPDPAELKTHYDKHTADIPKFKGVKEQSKFFVKMDITNLKCNFDEQNFNTIDEILTHLNEIHSKNILPEVKTLILPFKFDSNELRCCECSQTFHTFQNLQSHMHSHYSNYICDVCSAGFVTKKSLLVHRASHETGNVKCSYCSKVFDSQHKAKQHESYVHKETVPRSVCRFCNERFKRYTAKQKHLEEVHGVAPMSFKCLACDKLFARKHLLHAHTKRFHLMLRPHKCIECGMGFFSSSEMNQHMVKHTLQRKYHCQICPKSFCHRAALNRHRRIHNDDLRFKCEHCGHMFVTKTNLKRHMCKKHSKERAFTEKTSETKHEFEEVTVKTEIRAEVDAPVVVKRKKKVPDRNLELQSWRVAVRSLLASSNATTIRNHNDKGYGCSFCREQFPDPAELKKHSSDKHTAAEIAKYKGVKEQSKFFVKMDITNLKCKRRVTEKTSKTNVQFEEVSVKEESDEAVFASTVKKKINVNANLELECWRVAVRGLLASSNATAIRNHSDKGYGCCFCREQFQDPAELKTHNTEKHIADIAKFKGVKEQSKFFVKMDITNLKCNICEGEFTTIEQLITHLNEEHSLNIFPDIKRLILPFKFDSKELCCCECWQTFHTFKILQEHMHSHYSNYICDVCSSGFVTRNSLILHRASHETGSFKCTYCQKIFDSQQKARMHETKMHENAAPKCVCKFCNERFKDFRKKQKHLEQVHGVASTTYKCNACDKSFSYKNTLRYHTKRYHLMLRPHKCKECGMDFFTAFELSQHMVKHSPQSQYRCDVCPKTFCRKQSLKCHKRIHSDDMRFKCEHCGHLFVTKCNLKRHMLKKHS